MSKIKCTHSNEHEYFAGIVATGYTTTVVAVATIRLISIFDGYKTNSVDTTKNFSNKLVLKKSYFVK